MNYDAKKEAAGVWERIRADPNTDWAPNVASLMHIASALASAYRAAIEAAAFRADQVSPTFEIGRMVSREIRALAPPPTPRDAR